MSGARTWSIFSTATVSRKMGALFTPIGGGAIGKAEAFDIIAEQLCIHERPLSEVRLYLFRMVFDLGTHSQGQISNRSNPVELWDESWELLGNMYEALAEIEKQAMRKPHAENLALFLTTRAAEQEAEDRAAAA